MPELILNPGKCSHCKLLGFYDDYPDSPAYEECNYEPSQDIEWNPDYGESVPCPYWQPVEIQHCEKHGDYYRATYCAECENDFHTEQEPPCQN